MNTVKPVYQNVAITPATASEWLRHNTLNRPIMAAVVRRYAEEMRQGRWEYTHQGVAFDVNGVLVDGQHRLLAIVESGCTITMQVTFNLLPSTRITVDDHSRRTVHDALCLQGENVDRRQVAMITVMVQGMAGRYGSKLTKTDMLTLASAFRDGLAFATSLKISKLPGLRQAQVFAVLARAWYSQPKETLERFYEVLTTGEYKDESEIAAITLRTYLTVTTRARGGGRLRVETYRKVSRMLQAFINGEPQRRCIGTLSELFETPYDDTIKAFIGKNKAIIR